MTEEREWATTDTEDTEGTNEIINGLFLLTFLIMAMMFVSVFLLQGGVDSSPILLLGFCVVVVSLMIVVFARLLSKTLELGARQREKGRVFKGISTNDDDLDTKTNSFLGELLFSIILVFLLFLGTTVLETGIDPYAIFFFYSALAFLAWMLRFFFAREPVQGEVLIMAVVSAWVLVLTALSSLVIHRSPAGGHFILFVWLFGVLLPTLSVDEKARKNSFKRMAKNGDVQGLLKGMNTWAAMSRWSAAEGLGTAARSGHVREVVLGKGVELLVNHLVYQGAEQEKVWTALIEIAEAGEKDYVIDRVLRALDSPTPEVRYQAAQLLGNLGDPRVIPALKELVDQDDAVKLYKGGEEGFFLTTVARAAIEAVRKLEAKNENDDVISPPTPHLPGGQEEPTVTSEPERRFDQDKESRLPAGRELEEGTPGEELEVPGNEGGTREDATVPPAPTCPGCGKEVVVQWLVCQYCMTRLKPE